MNSKVTIFLAAVILISGTGVFLFGDKLFPRDSVQCTVYNRAQGIMTCNLGTLGTMLIADHPYTIIPNASPAPTQSGKK